MPYHTSVILFAKKKKQEEIMTKPKTMKWKKGRLGKSKEGSREAF